MRKPTKVLQVDTIKLGNLYSHKDEKSNKLFKLTRYLLGSYECEIYVNGIKQDYWTTPFTEWHRLAFDYGPFKDFETNCPEYFV